MMNKLITASFLSCLLMCSTLFAQQVHETSRKFMRKSSGNALSIVIQGQAKNVAALLNDTFKRETGTKGRNIKGVTAFEGVVFRPISPDRLDYYFEVEKASKNDDIHSKVILFISTGNYNFVSSADHPDIIEAARQWLEGLEMEVVKYEFDLAIAEQEKLIQKAQKEYDKMVQDSVKLEAKLAETLQAIEENKVGRANQLVKIEEEQKRLEEFRQELARLKGKNED